MYFDASEPADDIGVTSFSLPIARMIFFLFNLQEYVW